MQPLDLVITCPEDLEGWWRPGSLEGGVFVPGCYELEAGAPVQLALHLREPSFLITVVDGRVIWRRMPNSKPVSPRAAMIPGVGVALDPSMRARIAFVEQVARGRARNQRRAIRYPVSASLSAIVSDEHGNASYARFVDVSVRGMCLVTASSIRPQVDSRVCVRIARPGMEPVRMPARVAWSNDNRQIGLALDLGTTTERMFWAKVVTEARREFVGAGPSSKAH